MAATQAKGLGHVVAPPRFLMFLGVLAVAAGAGVPALGWRIGGMAGFDVAALAFIASCVPLLNNETHAIRDAARRNDANRAVLLGITGIVSVAVLVAVASELAQKGGPEPLIVALIVATLALAWLFSNLIYALHYAHIFYSAGDDGKDAGGLDFPETDEPAYWDFVYFSFTLGMTFQTSDVEMTATPVRVVAIFHCLAAFVFNIGVLAFSINVLGGSS